MTERTLDCRGLLCPLPALETRRELERVAPGTRLVVLCTDPAAEIDLRALCDDTGDRFVGCERSGGELHLTVERRG